MAAAAARKSVTEFKQQLTEGDFTIIPNEIFTRILDDNQRCYDMLSTGQERMEKIHQDSTNALNRIATALETSCTSSEQNSTNLLEKLDELILKMGSVNNQLGVVSTITDETLETMARNKTTKEHQIRRAKDLAAYYHELITKNVPYAPRKFRTTINRNTPDYEKPLHNENTIHKVNQDIKMMQERIKNWEEELLNIELDINDILPKLKEQRAEKFQKTITDKSEKLQREWADSFASLKRSHSKDIESGASQYLLKYSDEKDSEDESADGAQNQTKNWNGQDRGRDRGRGGRGNNNNRGKNANRQGNNRQQNNFNNNNNNNNNSWSQNHYDRSGGRNNSLMDLGMDWNM